MIKINIKLKQLGKKNLILAILFSFILSVGWEEKAIGQDPYSAALDLVMSGLGKVMQAQEYLQEHQKDIILIQESYDLLNSVLCQKNQFDFYAGLAVNMNSCLIKYNYTMTLVNLNMGYVNIIIAAATITQKITGSQTSTIESQVKAASKALNQSIEFMQKYGIQVKTNMNMQFYQLFGNPYFRSYNYSDVTHI